MVGNILDNIKNVEVEKVFTLFLTKIATWGCGKKINLQEMDCMSMLLGKDIKVSFWMEKNMERESIATKVEQSMMENGIKTGNMVSASILTLTVKNLKETG